MPKFYFQGPDRTKLHRENGPAVENDQAPRFFLYGIELSPEGYERWRQQQTLRRGGLLPQR